MKTIQFYGFIHSALRMCYIRCYITCGIVVLQNRPDMYNLNYIIDSQRKNVVEEQYSKYPFLLLDTSIIIHW